MCLYFCAFPCLICYVYGVDRVPDRVPDRCNRSRGRGFGADDDAGAVVESYHYLISSLRRYCDRTLDPRSERVRAASGFEWVELVRLGNHCVAAVEVGSMAPVVVFADTARLVPGTLLRGTAAVGGMPEFVVVVWVVEGTPSRMVEACSCRSTRCTFVGGTAVVVVAGLEVSVAVAVAGKDLVDHGLGALGQLEYPNNSLALPFLTRVFR